MAIQEVLPAAQLRLQKVSIRVPEDSRIEKEDVSEFPAYQRIKAQNQVALSSRRDVVGAHPLRRKPFCPTMA
jgi:hypothetical protein